MGLYISHVRMCISHGWQKLIPHGTGIRHLNTSTHTEFGDGGWVGGGGDGQQQQHTGHSQARVSPIGTNVTEGRMVRVGNGQHLAIETVALHVSQIKMYYFPQYHLQIKYHSTGCFPGSLKQVSPLKWHKNCRITKAHAHYKLKQRPVVGWRYFGGKV